MLLIIRRTWLLKLFDELISPELISEEFFSKPDFNQQLHQLGDASGKDRGERYSPKERLPSLSM
jgi:hypothetical protein